ncbi:Hypothetical predicted protein [Mytilus galloprovincialis]|uniref:Uncharacterized protein n=1 Tax=Mytilus galloprovincialis TaxID=29158 RepID=A0A8B6C276_MYTGA|nr:Hypothetical predicted protein [Mytilus galloprovincialis]
MCTVQLWLLVSGLIAISSAKHHHETTIKHTTKPPTTTTLRSIFYQSRTCNSVTRKHHAIMLLEEWVKHDNYNAVERLYHDIYHKSLQDRKRFFLDNVGSHSSNQLGHSYTSVYDEAFLNGNPDYTHVESYINTHMNAECRRQIMIWIEDLAKHHTKSPTETGEHCTDLRDANHVISLLNGWERHHHFADVQRLYLEVALGFHALTETNGDKEMEHDRLHDDDSVSDYTHVRLRLVRLSSYCRQIVFAWIEDDARKHTAPA